MRSLHLWMTGILAAFCLCTVSLCAQGQTADTKEAQASEAKGMPARATAADYQAQGQAGNITIGAEFAGHSVPKPDGPLNTEDYVVIETGFFGAPGSRLVLSIEDFSLRINGKKSPLSSTPYGLVSATLKDPAWSPPEEEEKPKSTKSGLSTGGQNDGGSTPPIVHVPIELRRAMALYLQKAALPQGDRALPAAGLIFFQYRGKTQSIHSMELIYSGPAGKATLALQP